MSWAVLGTTCYKLGCGCYYLLSSRLMIVTACYELCLACYYLLTSGAMLVTTSLQIIPC